MLFVFDKARQKNGIFLSNKSGLQVRGTLIYAISSPGQNILFRKQKLRKSGKKNFTIKKRN